MADPGLHMMYEETMGSSLAEGPLHGLALDIRTVRMKLESSGCSRPVVNSDARTGQLYLLQLPKDCAPGQSVEVPMPDNLAQVGCLLFIRTLRGQARKPSYLFPGTMTYVHYSVEAR